ncbi:MAG: iron-containing alcohol dehydrogenase [Spirochaetes bacterium]|nr:iron-containing alcohol dehydrogenase [Spirochaetota bacterium]
MVDFTFCVPTRFIFGKGSPAKAGEEAARYGKRILIHHDGGDYLSALLGTVRRSLAEAGLEVFELSGVVSSPRLSLVLEGAELCRKEKIDCILAVGGGSVMDSAKAIAFMAVNEGDFTEYVSYKRQSEKCLPVGCVVTLSGTGSEVSSTAMIVDDIRDPIIKRPLFQDAIRFRFAILDPSLTLSLPMRQTLSGAFDAITHVMEHYFFGDSELQDRICEAVIVASMDNMRAVIDRPEDFEVRAELQMAATLANSGLLGLGGQSDWAMHYMENPITTATHQPHGSTLAIIAPAWMRHCFKRNLKKHADFARKVMGVPSLGSDEATAIAGIDAFEKFLTEIGLPTRLSQIGVTQERFAGFAALAAETAGSQRVGGVSRLTVSEIVEIYRLAS